MCTEVKSMKKNNSKQPNQPNQNQEFATETDIQKVKEQNRKSQSGQNQFNATEFASETDVQEVREQNRQSEMKKQKANSSFNETK